MKTLKHMKKYKIFSAYTVVLSVVLFFTSFFSFYQNVMANITDKMAECAAIQDGNTRLKCFDDLSGRNIPVTVRSVMPATTEKVPSQTIDQPMTTQKEDKELQTITQPSIMSKQWELDEISRKTSPIIKFHRTNYFLPLAYTVHPNREPALALDRQARSDNTEAKFQISFKIKLWEDVMNKDVDLWFAYTQLSFWQIYNSTFSSPFRETNYEPELFLNFRTDYKLFGLDLFGLRGRIITLGIDHQSNGRSKPLSRSWNRIVSNFGFEKNNFNLYLKSWYRMPESSRDDDNPNIEKYMGYGELSGIYYFKKHRFSAMLRNNLRINENKGALQLDWSFPFPFISNDRINCYIQYFNGYGESLLDYNANLNRISIGMMLADWN